MKHITNTTRYLAGTALATILAFSPMIAGAQETKGTVSSDSSCFKAIVHVFFNDDEGGADTSISKSCDFTLGLKKILGEKRDEVKSEVREKRDEAERTSVNTSTSASASTSVNTSSEASSESKADIKTDIKTESETKSNDNTSVSDKFLFTAQIGL